METDQRFASNRFPRSTQYHPEWILGSVSGGANPLWLTEWLAEKLDLRPGMRVLDLGCGRAMSSIFLQREFGVQVWATDLWFSATENLRRIQDAGVADGVFPIHADARTLPFAAEFFDAIVSIDSFIYYGTDDLYLNYLAQFVRPGGQIGIAGAGLMREIDELVPEPIQAWWAQDRPWFLHSPGWWRRHWSRTGILDVEVSDSLTDGWTFWRDWLKIIAPDNTTEITALEADAGSHLGYTRTVGRRRTEAQFIDLELSMPIQYEEHPLLRVR